MSIQRVVHVLYQMPELTANECRVLMLLADQAFDSSHACVSAAKLAQWTGLAHQTILNVLSSLAARGYITRMTRPTFATDRAEILLHFGKDLACGKPVENLLKTPLVLPHAGAQATASGRTPCPNPLIANDMKARSLCTDPLYSGERTYVRNSRPFGPAHSSPPDTSTVSPPPLRAKSLERKKQDHRRRWRRTEGR